MSFISWTEALSVRIASIDEQHKTLIDIINHLYESMQVGKANASMRKILADLARYTVTHFSYEERLLRQYAYPETAAHQNSRSSLITQLKELQRKAERGAPISIATFSFLKRWLTGHILKDDRQYSQFLRAKRVR